MTNLCTTFRRVFFLLLIVGLFLPAVNVQAALSQQKMAAVMAVINMLLLDDRKSPIDEPIGERADLTLPLLIDNTFNVTESNAVYAAFELQEEGIELCFDLTVVVAGDFVVEVNGDVVSAVEGKDNCYAIPEPLQRSINYVVIRVSGATSNIAIDRFELAPSAQFELGLPILTRGGWDERAVRKVLKIFAFGGHATDTQIQLWSDMVASEAIFEMLNFDEHNLKLSPLAVGETYADTETMYGTFTDFANFISSEFSNIPIPIDRRNQYGLDGSNFDDGFNRMITVRGLNPFRQRIGFWETNYHLATNRDASVSRRQMAQYYDEIMQAHEVGLPYHEVMGVAAKSAAAAMQYGHRNNYWDGEECLCNDDFAREIHQLYYGIFGDGDPNHEDITIPETAKLLTGMPVHRINGSYELSVDFQPADENGKVHHGGDVMVLGQAISGVDASAKIDALMPISMLHSESLKNLPVMIISVLADDNLNEDRKNQLRAAWVALGADKSFLQFIQTYAISKLFNGPNQFKYLTTHERALYMANKNNLDNLEAYFGGASYSGRAGRTVGSVISEDFAGEFFKPLHNVFGGQTSFEASDSALAFENNYNRLTDREHDLRDAVQCDACDLGQPWQKKWADVLPQRTDGEYYVADVAQWLWNHAVGNLDNFTDLERAHLYSLLGAARIEPGSSSDGDHAFDFNLLMCVMDDYQFQHPEDNPLTDDPEEDDTVIDILTGGSWDDYCRASSEIYDPHELAALEGQYTGQAIADDERIQLILATLGNQTLPFNVTGMEHFDDGFNLRKHARERVSSALGFIFTTPFIFAEGQK